MAGLRPGCFGTNSKPLHKEGHYIEDGGHATGVQDYLGNLNGRKRKGGRAKRDL